MVYILVGGFIGIITLCKRTLKALVRLSEFLGSSEHLLLAYAIGTKVSCDGPNVFSFCCIK